MTWRHIFQILIAVLLEGLWPIFWMYEEVFQTSNGNPQDNPAQ
jgi:hypothetical protein